MDKLRIAILFGGASSEYRVSLASASAVLRHLDRTRYEPVPIGITREGNWYLCSGDPNQVQADCWYRDGECRPVALSPSRGERALWVLDGHTVQKLPIDAALPVLHGKNGEDGTVQGLMELAGIPLAGCGTLASALCMDKDRAHQLARQCGVRVPRSLLLEEANELSRAEAFAEAVGYPLFVKPVRSGSSFGISRVQRRGDLSAALTLAFSHDDRVLLEEAISGCEVGCAVLGTRELIVGAVDEIELSGGFFDFTEKYTLQTSAIHVPARISPAQTKAVQETAKHLYRALGCAGFARVDFFLTARGELVFNEINTIPGFTEHSRYPAMLRAAGYSFSEVLDLLIQEALR